MRLPDRIRQRLHRIERDAPDGALAGYLWLWRTLERTSTSSVWWLRVRFAWLVLGDATLLAAWAALRPILRLFARRPLVGAVATSLLLLIGATLLRPTVDPGATAPQAIAGFMPHVDIDVLSAGRVRFQGQVIRPEELPGVLRHFGVRSTSMRIAHDATYGSVHEIVTILADEGVSRTRVQVEKPPPPPPRR